MATLLRRSSSGGSLSGRSSSESGSRNCNVSTGAGVAEVEEDGFIISLEDRPPQYVSVLLETHLARSSRFEGLYPPALIDAIKSHLVFPAGPPPHPRRTWHTLVRAFDEGRGTYYGELDPKSRRSGFGHIVYESEGEREGNRYQGSWNKGLMEGTGSYMWAATGSVYQGAWRRGERNGKGYFVLGPLRSRGALPLAAVCAGVWSDGNVRRGSEMVRFVNGDGGVEVATVEEGDYDSGETSSSSESEIGNGVGSEKRRKGKNRRLGSFFKSIVKR